MEELLNFLVSNAYAADGQASQQGGGFSFLMMLLGFVLLVYFAIWRPQNKRVKEQQNLLTSLVKGDEVVTAGGILGRLIKLTDQYVVIAVANNIEIVMQKSSVMTVLPKGTLKSIE